VFLRDNGQSSLWAVFPFSLANGGLFAHATTIAKAHVAGLRLLFPKGKLIFPAQMAFRYPLVDEIPWELFFRTFRAVDEEVRIDLRNPLGLGPVAMQLVGLEKHRANPPVSQ
jgi:hypothetical protein